MRYGAASVDRIFNLYFMLIFEMRPSDLNVKNQGPELQYLLKIKEDLS